MVPHRLATGSTWRPVLSAPADIYHSVTGATQALATLDVATSAPLISRSVVRGAVRLLDFSLLFLVGMASALAYVPAVDLTHSAPYLLALALTPLAAVMIFDAAGLYAVSRLASVLRSISGVMLGWMAALALMATAVFFSKLGPDFSRVWLALWFSIGALSLVATRTVVAFVVSRWIRDGRLSRRAVIYGGLESTRALVSALENADDSDLQICGIFDDRTDARTPGAFGDLERLGALRDLVTFARRTRVDVVILNLPVAAETRVLEAIREISVLPVDIRLPADATRIRFQPRTYSYVGDVAFIDIFDRPIGDWGLVGKWVFDKTIASLAIVLLAPVMLTIAAIIKLTSKGPVLFRQKRYGFNNELIEVLKFRSMYTDMSDVNAAKLVTRDDPRVTPIGRFIRKTSIDELPQLFNVLRGELSLVGPRPHALQAKAADRLYQDVVDGYFARHKVKPGITGWAQINGWRGETDTPEKIKKRVEYDLYYIENWSLFLDLYILVGTPFALFNSENAY